MHTLVIVDDEPAIREGMPSLIDWENFGFRIAGTARNGEEGLRLHEELAPDLMLIDIRMPRKNGLELLEDIRRSDSRCRVLILSGHADFAYAQQAIRFGIEGYMLKPVNEEELEDYARRIAESLDAEKSASGGGLPVREEALAKLLAGAAGDARDIAALVVRDADPAGGAIACRMLLAEPAEDGDAPLGERVFRERLAAAAERAGAGVVVDAKPGVAWLLPESALAPPDGAAGESAAQAGGGSRAAGKACGGGATPPPGAAGLHGAAGECLAARLLAEAACGAERYTAAAGPCATDAAAVRASLASARELMRHRFLLEPGRVHAGPPALLGQPAGAASAAAGAEPAPSGGAAGAAAAEPDLAGLALRLSRVIDAGNEAGISAFLEEAASSIAAFNSSRAYVTASIAQLLTHALAELETLHDSFSAQEHNNLIATAYKQPNLPALMKELDGALRELPGRLGISGTQPALRRMTDYIERHYDEPLRLETLAEMFNYNSGYLGKLFKNHTGDSFNTYLDRVRIARAIELLSEGVKVRQAAEKVGYANVDYFHAKFKKYTGQSPSAYKKAEGQPVERG